MPDNFPESAACTVYMPGADNELVDAGFTLDAYNFSLEDIPGDWWVLLKRDKFGLWWAEQLGGGGQSAYIVRTPTAGIPGMSEHETGTGTQYEDDEPNYAACEVYELLEEDEESGTGFVTQPRMVALDFTIDVFNLSRLAIPGDTWILAVKEAGNNWIAINPLTAGTADCVSIPGVDLDALPVTDDSTGTGDAEGPPDYVLGIRDGCLVRVPVGEC